MEPKELNLVRKLSIRLEILDIILEEHRIRIEKLEKEVQLLKDNVFSQ